MPSRCDRLLRPPSDPNDADPRPSQLCWLKLLALVEADPLAIKPSGAFGYSPDALVKIFTAQQ